MSYSSWRLSRKASKLGDARKICFPTTQYYADIYILAPLYGTFVNTCILLL